MQKENLIKIGKELLKEIDENWEERSDLRRTPERFANMIGEWFTPENFKFTKFVVKEKNPSFVVINNIKFLSFCEHHIAPIIGSVSIGYLPNNYIGGLSKFARLVSFLSKALIIQETFTESIFNSLMSLIDPKALIVKVSGYHFCISQRGIKSQDSYTITEKSNLSDADYIKYSDKAIIENKFF